MKHYRFLPTLLLASALIAPAAWPAAPSMPAVALQASLRSAKDGIQAFPRVLPGPGASPAALARINTALAHDDAKARAAAGDCRDQYRQAHGVVRHY